MSEAKAFTKRARERRTKTSVRWIDFGAKWGIIVGGIATIAVVLLVCVYLAWVTLPLFLSPSLEATTRLGAAPWGNAEPVAIGSDDQQRLGWALLPDGRFMTYRLDEAEGDRIVSDVRPLAAGEVPTSFSVFAGTNEFAVGFASGKMQRGKIVVSRQVKLFEDLPAAWQAVPPGGMAIVDDRLLLRAPDGENIRELKIDLEVEDSTGASPGSSIVLIDQSARPTGPILATLSADGKLRVHSGRTQESRETGRLTTRVVSYEVPYAVRADGAQPSRLLISGVGDNVYLVWNDGLLRRYDVRESTASKLIEEIDVVPEADGKVTAFSAMIGKTTLVVGDSLGRTRGWFRVKPEGNAAQSAGEGGDGSHLVAAHELAQGTTAVVRLAPSTASRLISVGYADDRVRLFNMTTENQLLELLPPEVDSRDSAPVVATAIAPRDDGLLAESKSAVTHWKFNPRHPEVSFASLFRPVWYEGAARPQHVWQSSSGSDSYEPKYGFGPLVFGTCKAAFYSLLFAVPIALLAAVYTSEFLSPHAKKYIKPGIELMAGLPSVVLGFIAALVLAPLVEPIVGSVLAGIVLVPFSLLLGAHVWQLLPRNLRLQWEHERFVAIIAALLVGPLLAWLLGPTVERLLFAGDVKEWLAGRIGSAAGGWMFFLLPIAALASFFILNRLITPKVHERIDGQPEFRVASVQLGLFALGTLITLALAWLGGALLGAVGQDPRGPLVGEYQQLNTMIVGLTMGFAIIPIIFTIAEDALSTVPMHLRSASLGAGATRWQTAIRIVVPTAMSGLFSAVMVGLGRAVGETMIVLMAAGNTAIIDLNIFNGFRTLPANIAVELPEAVRDSTHYRTLFLAALVLFGLTFALNTVAELIRQRFRRRAYQL